jgi:diadenosine tetraphosphatase ApaH/serine/threonine PP2A family protein phosphatase
VFSDLHADGGVLDVLWSALDREVVDGAWCLGDFCVGGPDAARCFDEVTSRCEVVLAGNHERFVVERAFEELRGRAADQARLAHAQLGHDRRRVLARLPSGGLARGVFAVHGRPDAPTYGFLQTAEHAAAARARVNGRLVVYGHTHQPAWWEPTVDGRVFHRRVPTGIAVPVAAGSLLNPGAACDSAGVRWLALELRRAAAARFTVTFHLEPAPR